MDDDDQYVPNMSAMDSGGFNFADLSSDSYVPPPPGPADPHHPHLPPQHPPQYFAQPHGLPLHQHVLRPPPPTHQMVPGTAGGGKKKKMTKAQQAAMQQQYQQSPYPPQQFQQPGYPQQQGFPEHQGYPGPGQQGYSAPTPAYQQPAQYARQAAYQPQYPQHQYPTPQQQQPQPAQYPSYPQHHPQGYPAGYPAQGYPQQQAQTRYPGYPAGYPQSSGQRMPYPAQYQPGPNPQGPYPQRMPYPQGYPKTDSAHPVPPQPNQHAGWEQQRRQAYSEIQHLQGQLNALQNQPQTQQSMHQMQQINQRMMALRSSMEAGPPQGYSEQQQMQQPPTSSAHYQHQQQHTVQPPAYPAQHPPPSGQQGDGQGQDSAGLRQAGGPPGQEGKSETPPPPVPSLNPPSYSSAAQQPPASSAAPVQSQGMQPIMGQGPTAPSSMSVMLHEAGPSVQVKIGTSGGSEHQQPAAIISLYPYPPSSQQQQHSGGQHGHGAPSPGGNGVPPEPIPTPPQPSDARPPPLPPPTHPSVPSQPRHQLPPTHMGRPMGFMPQGDMSGQGMREAMYPGQQPPQMMGQPPRMAFPPPSTAPPPSATSPGSLPMHPPQQMAPINVATPPHYGYQPQPQMTPPTPTSDPSGGEDTPKAKKKRGPRKKKEDDGSPQKSPARRGRPPKIRPPPEQPLPPPTAQISPLGALAEMSPAQISPAQQMAPLPPQIQAALITPPMMGGDGGPARAVLHGPPPGAPTQQKLPVPVLPSTEASALPPNPLPPPHPIFSPVSSQEDQASKDAAAISPVPTAAPIHPPVEEMEPARHAAPPADLSVPKLEPPQLTPERKATPPVLMPPSLPPSIPPTISATQGEEMMDKKKAVKKGKKPMAMEFEHADSPSTPPATAKDKSRRPKYQEKKKKTKKRKKEDYEVSEGEEAEEAPKGPVDVPFTADDIPDDLKRRSARTGGKRKKYNEEPMLDLDFSDDDDKIPKKQREGGEEEPSAPVVPAQPKPPKEKKVVKKKKEKVEQVLITMEELDEELPPPTFQPTKDEDLMVVERILLYRRVKKLGEGEEAAPRAVAEEGHPHKVHRSTREETTADDEDGEDEYYVKYKNFSYLHCEWRTFLELDTVDKRFAGKAKRFQAKRETATTFLDEQFDEDEPFNPDYLQVERVLDVSTEIIPKPSWNYVLKKGKRRKAREEKAKKAREAVLAAEAQRKAERAARLAAEKEAKEAAAAAAVENGGQLPLDATVSATSSATPSATPSKETTPAPDKPEVKREEAEESGDGEVSQDGTRAEEEEDEEEESEDEGDSASPAGLTHYLVKWRNLQYEDATWEVAKDVEAHKIAEFQARRYPKEWHVRERGRPSPGEWRKRSDFQIFKNENELRDYQSEGLNWLLFCWYNKQNCILADEMGLGKTIQSITFLHEVQKYGIHGPFLVIAPLSTIHNWQRECETWSDINAVVYHGTSMSRGMIAEYEMFYRDEAADERVKGAYKFDLLITTYEMILVDCDALKEIPWRICIIDEAHRLKNRNCSLLRGLALFRIEHRVLLTGTPLQNNIDELFSLLNFLEPKQFASRNAFLEEFGDCQSDEQVSKIQDILKPMMLRRLKEDVEKTLKPKEETIVEVELTNIQKKYYRAILEKNFSYLSRGASAPSLMNTMMELRKCCNHPFLINGAEEQIMEDYSKMTHSKERLDEETVFQTCLVQSSGKMVLCDKLLPRLKKEGHKVLIFSQMVRVLNLIEDYLVDKRYPFERIDGNVRGDMRQAAIDRFSKPDSDRFVFLLCTRAGGLGINLTAADTCIIFDSDWNPQNDLQAQARCHRIGQEKSVKIYRLITRNTYEREMFDKASLKLGLDKAVLQSTGTKDNCAAQLSKKEVEELLRKGAYAAVMDEASEGDKFCEEDIDQILQRRTQTITIQAGVKGSTFAKASFNMSGNREDIDVNDPNFWQKWAKKANVETPDPQAELIIYEPRTRKRRFNEEVYNQMGNSEDSDSDSDSGGKGRKRGRPTLDGDLDYAPDELAFTKTDYFKVEKLLGIYGWGRWAKIHAQCDLKTDVSVEDVGHMCRTVLLHCLRNFTGDDKVREFTWELIRPPDATDEDHKSFKALKKLQAETTPRGGRKSSRIAQNEKAEAEKELMDMYHQGWAALPAYNPPVMAVDYAYQRHLQRHANKVLLRIKLLHYLKEEIIGHLDQKIDAGMPSEAIDLEVPWHPELPVPWWDAEADKSLLIGIFKHGYESFNEMLDDPSLCFFDRCGPSEFEEEKAGRAALEAASEEEEEVKKAELEVAVEAGKKRRASLLPFPSVAELNARFKRLVTLYQRSNKIHMAREEQRAKRASKQEHIQALLQERELRRLEERQRWSRREETDFYRTLISFGIEQDPDTGEYRWERFRILARLETKFDQTLTEHYTALHAMCKRLTKKPLSKAEEAVSYIAEPLSEDRCSKALSRVELMSRVRAAVRHPKLGQRISLVKKTPDLPFWWESPLHDADLLIGVAKHGVARSEDTIVHDPDLSFAAIWHRFQKDPASLARELEAVAKAAKEAEPSPLEDQPKSKDLANPSADSMAESESRAEEKTNGDKEGDNSVPGPLLPPSPAIPTQFKETDSKETDDKDLKIESQKEAVDETKSNEKLKESTSVDDDEKNAEKKSEEAKADKDSVPKSSKDPDATISQILAQASGNTMQWPKERMIIFRLHNICYTIEHGEWPTGANSKGSGSSAVNSDLDNRSTTPESTRGTPFDDLARDSPLYNFPLTKGGKSGRATPKMSLGGLGSSSSSGRRGRKQKSSLPSNPLQDLMESEREKMRVLMHQSFLQQLEQFPLAAAMAMNPGALPPGLLDCLGIPPGLLPGLSATLPSTPSSSAPDNKPEEVLNLSTKAKKEPEKTPASTSSSSAAKGQHKPLSMKDMMDMSTLPGETRVPVLSLKDGKRLTGKEAPMIKNLAQWLSEHPHHIIDMPPQGIAGLFGDLEPGEIPRPSPKTSKPSTSHASPSASSSSSAPTWEERITVINRKNGLKLAGSKAPQLKNLIMWLEKNPDWDVDPSQASAVKGKLKLPDKLKSRVSGKTSESVGKKGSAPTPPAAGASSSSMSGLSALGLDPFAGMGTQGLAGLDAATQLQIQMQLMMMGMGGGNPMSNPAALLGLPPAMLSPDIASMLGAGLGSPNSFGLPIPTSTPVSSTPTNTPSKESASRSSSSGRKDSTQISSTPTTKTSSSAKPSHSSSSSSKAKTSSSSSSKPSSSSTSHAQAQKDALAAAQHLQNLSEDPLGLGLAGLDAATASALNPFLGGLGIPTSSGIFGGGMNPFLGGMGGMGALMGGAAVSQAGSLPSSLAAMAQLQSLMGLEALAGFPPGLFPHSAPSPSASTSSSSKKKPSTPSKVSESPSKSGASITAGTSATSTPTTSKAPVSANSGGRKKLNALVEKLAESAAQAHSESPPSLHHVPDPTKKAARK